MGKFSKALSPSDIVALKISFIPDLVYDAFNELIAKNFDGIGAFVKQDEVVALIITKMPHETNADSINVSSIKQKIHNEHWLDIEEAYRKEGWKVEYEKSDYSSSDPSVFSFSLKKR